MDKQKYKYADALVDPGLDSQLKELGRIADLADEDMGIEGMRPQGQLWETLLIDSDENMGDETATLRHINDLLEDNEAWVANNDLGGVVGMLNSDESKGGAIEAIGAVLIAYCIFAAFIYAVFLMASL
jgi:hypothetical protein